jgi:hypothetical protein
LRRQAMYTYRRCTQHGNKTTAALVSIVRAASDTLDVTPLVHASGGMMMQPYMVQPWCLWWYGNVL